MTKNNYMQSAAMSAMQGMGRSAEIKVKPWAFLVFLPLVLLSFPSLSLADHCAGANEDIALSYILMDEFGEQTSVARIGGTLVITCENHGENPPGVLATRRTRHHKFPSPDDDGKLKIKIEPKNVKGMEIYCYCGQEESISSKETLDIKNVLCSPIQDGASPCSKTEVCDHKSDGTRFCESGVELCTDGDQTPHFPYRLWGLSDGQPTLSSISYCKALKKAENEKLGQVEFDGATADFQSWWSKFEVSPLSEIAHNGLFAKKMREKAIQKHSCIGNR